MNGWMLFLEGFFVLLLVPQETRPSRLRFEIKSFIWKIILENSSSGGREGCRQLESVIKQVVTAGNCGLIPLGERRDSV